MESPAQSLPSPAQHGFQQLLNPQRVGFMLTGAIMIAVLVAGYMWSQTPDYRVLYGNLSDRDGGAVVAALQQMNVPYKFAEGGALSVPAGQLHELRLRLAAQGLPKGGLSGFELMESQKFGTSQFAEQINYQRGLEGELARSIQTLSAVQNARVHLALARQTGFMREQPKPSASVILGLFPGRVLEANQVSAIVHLVSNSVPDLHGKNVSIVDQHGNLLSAERTESNRLTLDPAQIKYRHELEQSYISRIESILAPLTGAQNVRAQVTAELDFTQSEHAEEIYKPNQDGAAAAVRSKQTSEANAKDNPAASGVPGALTNQPPAQATAPITGNGTPATAATATGTGRKDATINYEVDKTIRHTRQELGRIKRLAVAVVVNHRSRTDAKGKVTQVPLSEADIAKLNSLVKEVMGYDKERGDTVSVINSAFSVKEKEKIPEVPLWKDPETIDLAKVIGKNALIAAVLLFLVMGVLRPMLKTYSTPPAPPPALTPPEPATATDAQPPQLNSYEQHVDQAKQIARSDPKAVANVVKEWVASNGK